MLNQLATQVQRLEDQKTKLYYLCDEMINTILMTRNKDFVSKELMEAAEMWRRRFVKVENDV